MKPSMLAANYRETAIKRNDYYRFCGFCHYAAHGQDGPYCEKHDSPVSCTGTCDHHQRYDSLQSLAVANG